MNNDIKQNLNNPYAQGILPNLNFADNTPNFGEISPLVRWLRASEAQINYTVSPGSGGTYDSCGVIRTGNYNGFDLMREPDNCNNTFGSPTWCMREFPIHRFGFEKCDVCADYNDYIVRKGSDLTGGAFKAGDSVTDTMMEMIATGYNFTLNKGVVVGDPLATNVVVPGISSLESVYIAANGVNVVSGMGLPVWKAIEVARNQKFQKGITSTAGSVWLMHPMTELRMREEARQFYTDLSTSFDPLAGIQIITDIQVPVVAGKSKIYELQAGNVGLHMRFPTAKTQTFDEDHCGKKCYVMYNYASVFAVNPCALTVIEDVQVENTKFGNYNPVNPQVFC